MKPSLRIHDNYFPQQKVSAKEKEKAVWYANCIDFIIDKGISCNDMEEIEKRISILHGEIPQEFYAKTLNPYNQDKENLKRFPATMRNLDIITDIVRRYVGEYTKSPHDFVVGSNSPDLVINRNNKLKAEVTRLCQEAFASEFQNRLQQMQQEIQQQEGQKPQQIAPEQVMSQEEIEAFVKKFNEDYVDKETKQGEELFDYIRDHTRDEEIYAEAYFNFVAFGRCFTYHDVRNGKIYKENVPISEAYPIPTTDKYVENHDMFARCTKMSKAQILDMFDGYLDKKDREFFETYYSHEEQTGKTKLLGYNQYFETYADVCDKFTEEERNLFKTAPIEMAEVNGDLYDVWHVVWKSYSRVGVLTYINEIGLQDTMVVEDGFKLQPELGHIDLSWEYVPQVYEGYRIGNRYNAIYPIKARPTLFNRDNHLPYNGILEPIPLMGEFSIVKIIAPYQILRNIISYHREMVIAKNKLLILIMPESLIEDRSDDRIYRMAADGTLIYDDSVDSNSLKAQQIRLLNANMGDYIRQLTELIENIKNEAREMVDMTPQRYGQIATSAGKSTTEEAIARGSMGSVTINFVFDKFRNSDYNGDLDLAKLAFIDGLADGYFDKEDTHRTISLDANSILNSDLSVFVKNTVKENEKLEQLRKWAFNASQNGDLEMAIAAITGNSVSSMKVVINQFVQMKQQREMELKQADQMIEQAKIDNKIKEIESQGEIDARLLEMKYAYELQMKYAEVDMSILTDTDTSTQDKNASQERIEAGRRDIERMKLDIERQRLASENYNAAADRNVQREQMQNDLKIAKTNKNRYDK